MRAKEWRLTDQELTKLNAVGGDIAKAQEAKKKAWLEASPQKGEMILLTDEKLHHYYVNIEDSFIPRWLDTGRQTAKAQLKKVAEDIAELLDDDAYYDHRIGAVADYLESLLKEVE